MWSGNGGLTLEHIVSRTYVPQEIKGCAVQDIVYNTENFIKGLEISIGNRGSTDKHIYFNTEKLINGKSSSGNEGITF